MSVWKVDGYRESSISRSDRVSGVINHMLRSRPHQGLAAQETGALERSHTPKSSASPLCRGWGGVGRREGLRGAGVQALFSPERVHTHASLGLF